MRHNGKAPTPTNNRVADQVSVSSPGGVSRGRRRNRKKAVKLDYASAIGRVGKLEAEGLSVLFGLLQAVSRGLVPALGLDNGNDEVPSLPEQIVNSPPAAERLAITHGQGSKISTFQVKNVKC